jgi:hypothetical protein
MIIVEPEPDRPGQIRVPVDNRLRQWLKIGLRGFRLRAVSVLPAERARENEHQTGAEHGTTAK